MPTYVSQSQSQTLNHIYVQNPKKSTTIINNVQTKNMTNSEQNIHDEDKSKPYMHERIWNEDLEVAALDIIPNLLDGVSARGLRNTEKFAERRRDSLRLQEAGTRTLGSGSSGGGDVSLGGFH